MKERERFFAVLEELESWIKDERLEELKRQRGVILTWRELKVAFEGKDLAVSVCPDQDTKHNFGVFSPLPLLLGEKRSIVVKVSDPVVKMILERIEQYVNLESMRGLTEALDLKEEFKRMLFEEKDGNEENEEGGD